MPARTGAEFLDRLSRTRTHVEIQGETLHGGIPDHPAFKNVVRSYAALFDLQHAPECRDVLTYQDPGTNSREATSFLIPRTREDLAKRAQAYKLTADASFGMLGRTGDYLNSALMALASADDWFAQTDAAFADNITRYYQQVRDQDLLCTHTLIPPQANRAQPGSQQGGGALMAHIASEDDNGIVVRGARMLATIGPFADELLVFPSTVLRGTPEDKPYSFAFAIPTDAPGLQVHRQGAVRLRPLALRPPARLALRRVRRGGGLRRRARPLRALLHARRPRALQRLLHQDGRPAAT